MGCGWWPDAILSSVPARPGRNPSRKPRPPKRPAGATINRGASGDAVDDHTFAHWVELPEGQLVRFCDLAGLIAGALHGDEFAQAAAESEIEKELESLVDSRELEVLNPLTLAPHSFPVGDGLRRAVLLPHQGLRRLLASRGIGLRLTPYGTGPTYWTIENTTKASAEQEGWNQGARDSLVTRMLEAATSGSLTVRDPHTDLAYRPSRVREYYDLVTRTDVNEWLAKDPVVALRWKQSEPTPVAVALPVPPSAAPASAIETPKQRRARLLQMHDAEVSAGRARGALARITKIEKRTRPTADRSNIGKAIRKAREERDAERRGGALTRLLG